MSEQDFKDKIEELEETVSDLEDQIKDKDSDISDICDERDDLEDMLNSGQAGNQAIAETVENIHQQIVYQGKDPLDVLDDLMREHGFIWSKAAA